MFQVNTLEKEHAKLIKYEIDKYERESGIEVKYISFYRDKAREFDTSKLKRILQSLETGLFFCQIFVFII